ncbi:uncharacterized protein LOC105683019 isoform X1 [Athalia rosae]|uniref:uncharacterized protein LOC105683019 isoform X1 n=1 Tax=Athalia rosae TaxID=37344 RepID=UPI002033A65F|nr:uncharacterized protein LOC105683019 isoform X1 [Athalia rosae]
MWTFLFLAGLFSGWWGALSLAAPPAPNLLPSTISSSEDSPMTSYRVRDTLKIRRDAIGSSPLASALRRASEPYAANDNEGTARPPDHLEPYRYASGRHRDAARSQTSPDIRVAPPSRANAAESPENHHQTRSPDRNPDSEGPEDSSSKFRYDSLPRLRYREPTDAQRLDEIPGNGPDDALSGSAAPKSASYTPRSRRTEENAVTPTEFRGYFPDGRIRLENFMNYQVTPTSLRTDGDFDHEIPHRDIPAESVERERIANNRRTTLKNVEGYRRRHREEEGDRRSTAVALYPSAEEPELAPQPAHTTQQSGIADAWDTASSAESAMERPRVTRAANSNNKKSRKRTKANSPREQRRQGRNKERRGQNWCPDVDVGNRAFLAPTVFEGKARSMSSVRKPGSNYAVTFEVKQVYKSQPGFQPLLKNDSVRLHFRDKVPGKSTLCGGSEANGQDGQGGVVRANIKRGKVYLVFVSRVGPRNFTILGEPMIRSKKNAQAVQAVIRPDYVREVTLSELRDAVARLRDRVKLVCRTRGSPPPKVHWLKDGVPLHPRRGLKIQHKRRRSKVVIASARAEDSGQYECVAESTSGHRAALAAKLLVTHAPETTTAAWPRQEAPCPITEDFCMNGGTCLFFETVGEPACRCAEGFTGLRCENKDVMSTGSAYSRHRAPFSCKLGLSTSYYC